MSRIALLLIDHGSRSPEANAQLDALAELVCQRAGDDVVVRTAHLSLGAPTVDEAFAECASAGIEEVVVVPCLLAPGRHAREDVPRQAADAARAHGLRYRVAPPLGVDPLLAELVMVRAGMASRERFVVFRGDGRGVRARVASFATLDEAEALLAALDAPTYWVERA